MKKKLILIFFLLNPQLVEGLVVVIFLIIFVVSITALVISFGWPYSRPTEPVRVLGSRFSILYFLKECEIDPQLVALQYEESKMKEVAYAKQIALIISIINLIISFVIFISFNVTNQGSFILMEQSIGDITLSVDGQSIFFVLLTTFITPICLLSN